VRALAVYDGPRWQVDHLLLVSSRPGAGRGSGPLYETVETFALGR
jgi:2'-5' RNA ligase